MPDVGIDDSVPRRRHATMNCDYGSNELFEASAVRAHSSTDSLPGRRSRSLVLQILATVGIEGARGAGQGSAVCAVGSAWHSVDM